MGNIISRFKDIMSANINALLDNVEDPEKMIDQYLRNLESDLGKVKAETATVMAEEKRKKRELDELTSQINKMQKYTEKALLAGNEDDAKTFLEKKNQLSQNLQSLQVSHQIALENAEKMKSMHDKLVEDIQTLNSKRHELKSKLSVAKTQEKMNKIGSSLQGAKGSLSEFDRMEDKINKKLDEANAMAELNTPKKDDVEDLMDKYDDNNSENSQVNSELDELKKKLGL